MNTSTRTKKMSNFCGCHKLVIIVYILQILFSCSWLGVAGISMADDHDQHENPVIYQLLSSREDMAQIAGYGEEKLSTVLITGSLHCEEAACNLHAQTHHHHHFHSWPVSGALVSVNCHIGGKKRSSWAQGVTDEFGDFTIDLPSNLHAIPNLDKRCSARVIQIPKNTPCQPAYVKRHKGLKLSSVGNGIRTYSAGRISFQHFTSKSSQACIKKRSSNKQMLSQIPTK